MRDAGLLDSALQRPRNPAAYAAPDAAATFLEANGWRFGASETDVVDTILALAAGYLGEHALADWFRANRRMA